MNKINCILQNDYNFYLSLDGIGDLLIVLAEAYKDPNAFVINCTTENKIDLTNDFFNILNVKNHSFINLEQKQIYDEIYMEMKSEKKLYSCGHLPDNLDYFDWLHKTEKYVSKITKKTDWIKRIGTKNKKELSLILAPRGGNSNHNKMRHLTPEEFEELVQSYVKKWKVYCIGSREDREFYPRINSKNCFWINSNEKIHESGDIEKHSFSDFLKEIHSASRIISVDTWIKTYTLLCGMDTFIIKTRNNTTKEFFKWGEFDPGDKIFLNPAIWPKLKMCEPKELIFF